MNIVNHRTHLVKSIPLSCKICSMNGLLVYAGPRDNPSKSHQIQLFTDAFLKFKIRIIAVSITEIHRVLETTTPGFFKFAFLLDEDTQIAKFLEEEYHLKVFNDEVAINASLDRALFAITLRNADISGPVTIALPHTPNQNVMANFAEVKAMMEEIQYPILIKHRRPSPQEKIYFVQHESQLPQVLSEIGMQPLIAQAYFPPTDRKQLKVLVVGKKVLTTIEVVTIHEKEFLKVTIPSREVKKLAILATKAIGATYALVSLFQLQKKSYVYAIKTNPNIVELQVVSGVYLAWYIAKQVYRLAKKKW